MDPVKLMPELFIAVRPFYSCINRHYHNIQHVTHMLEGYNKLEVEHTIEMFSAILFHDVFYLPGAPDGYNESTSASMFPIIQQQLAGYEDMMLSKAVKDLIMCTTLSSHESNEPSPVKDGDLIRDLDLLSMSFEFSRFSEVQLSIQLEFRHLGATANKQAKWLLAFLNARNGRVFRTPHFEHLNDIVYDNITQYAATHTT